MFWKLFLAHALTDFLLQTENMVKEKSRLPILAIHCGIFFVLSILFLAGELTLTVIAGLAGLSAMHGLIDWAKIKVQSIPEGNGWLWFLLDQALHLTAIAFFTVYFVPDSWPVLKELVSPGDAAAQWPLILSLSVAIVVGGGYFTATVCNGFLPENTRSEKPGIRKAGRYIGVLERALVMAAVLAGKFEIIGFLLAAKSIARYPEMKEHFQFAEYYLVGTLTSISWAFFGTLLLKQLLQ